MLAACIASGGALCRGNTYDRAPVPFSLGWCYRSENGCWPSTSFLLFFRSFGGLPTRTRDVREKETTYGDCIFMLQARNLEFCHSSLSEMFLRVQAEQIVKCMMDRMRSKKSENSTSLFAFEGRRPNQQAQQLCRTPPLLWSSQRHACRWPCDWWPG